jgi:hypothetical protein
MDLKEIKKHIREDGSFEVLFKNLLDFYFKQTNYPYSLKFYGFGELKFNNEKEMVGRIKMLADILQIESVTAESGNKLTIGEL